MKSIGQSQLELVVAVLDGVESVLPLGNDPESMISTRNSKIEYH